MHTMNSRTQSSQSVFNDDPQIPRAPEVRGIKVVTGLSDAPLTLAPKDSHQFGYQLSHGTPGTGGLGMWGTQWPPRLDVASSVQSPAWGRAGLAAPVSWGKPQASSPPRSGNPSGRQQLTGAKELRDVIVKTRNLTRTLKVQGKSQRPLHSEKTEEFGASAPGRRVEELATCKARACSFPQQPPPGRNPPRAVQLSDIATQRCHLQKFHTREPCN